MSQEIDAADVLSKYLMMRQSSHSSMIMDENNLPYPKAIIKAVLLHCLKLSPASPQNELLRSAYVGLAEYQTLTEDEATALQDWNSATENVHEFLSDEESLNRAKRLSRVGDRVMSINRRVTLETESLIQELKYAVS